MHMLSLFDSVLNHVFETDGADLYSRNYSISVWLILPVTEAPILDLHPSISNGFVSSKIYNKRDDFDDCDVPRRPSYQVYISQLIRFARVCSHVEDFNARKNV